MREEGHLPNFFNSGSEEELREDAREKGERFLLILEASIIGLAMRRTMLVRRKAVILLGPINTSYERSLR